MDKRTFLKKSAVLGLGSIAAAPGLTAQIINPVNSPVTSAGDRFTLPELPYAYDALAPHIDAMTMEVHHSKHHAGYTRKFNAALEGTAYSDMAVKDMFARVSELPTGIRNNGGGWQMRLS